MSTWAVVLIILTILATPVAFALFLSGQISREERGEK